ncbi:hypothetical protein [Salinigranum marinum]|uniref:hypothetical protein n=1 Tax=Salinigranum marinum TaxID=1515595 RepID=UPI00298A015F|nr:hypothetical protein [Salinigranum marinum]
MAPLLPSAGVAVVLLVVPLVATIGFAVWVHRDATARGSDRALGWAMLTALVGLGATA